MTFFYLIFRNYSADILDLFLVKKCTLNLFFNVNVFLLIVAMTSDCNDYGILRKLFNKVLKIWPSSTFINISTATLRLDLKINRYDVGRYTVERWNKLNENLRILAQKPWNVFGGNNLYDARYLQYYTGIKTRHLPSVCDYTGAEYTNEINEFLVLRRRDRGFNKIFFDTFNNISAIVSLLFLLNQALDMFSI